VYEAAFYNVYICTPSQALLGINAPGFEPGFRKTWVFKKAQPTGFWGFSDFFYLNQPLGSLLVDLAQQLSFYIDLSVLLSI